jgi:hypothetical protein
LNAANFPVAQFHHSEGQQLASLLIQLGILHVFHCRMTMNVEIIKISETVWIVTRLLRKNSAPSLYICPLASAG